MMSTKIISHRGSKKFPENTIPAFNHAVELGCDGVEFDVRLTKDKCPVVIHDPTLDRTTAGSGNVSDFTLSELRSIKANRGYETVIDTARIPSLQEVFHWAQKNDLLLNVELKAASHNCPNIEQAAADLVEMYRYRDRVIVSSFDHIALAALKRINSDIQTGLLYGEVMYNPWSYFESVGADFIHPHYSSLTPSFIEACRERGFKLNPYTIDDPDMLNRFCRAGLHGIITNFPDRIIGKTQQ